MATRGAAPAVVDYIEAVKRHAKRTGYSIHGLFNVAGVAYTNWHRWQRGTSPTARNVEKLLAVKPKAKKRRAR